MKEIFVCPEESKFYSHCLESLVLSECGDSQLLVEFGSGDGSPVINALLRVQFSGLIRGFELNQAACKIANSMVEEYNLDDKYIVQNQSFFEFSKPDSAYLISNPPYLPAPDEDIYMPLLRGGSDGSGLTKRLLSLGYDSVLLMISSFSDPKGTVDYAKLEGYNVADFVVVPLKFGYYSSEPKVRTCIEQMRENNTAFYSGSIYFLGGVLFKKQLNNLPDLSAELIQVMTSL